MLLNRRCNLRAAGRLLLGTLVLAAVSGPAAADTSALDPAHSHLKESPKEPGPGKAPASDLVESAGETSAEAPQVLAAALYSDPKGFFQIRPPAGWSINEYPDDPRGKVAFRTPSAGDWTQSGAELKVLGLLSAPGRSIAAAREEIEATADRLRAGLGASIEVTETTVLGHRAVRMTSNMPGKLRQEVIEILIGQNQYNFAFGAAPHRYDHHYPIARKAMETLLPILRDLPEEEATRHLVASSIRRAEVYRQMGQLAWAGEAVDEGLRLEPGNEKLRQMKREFANP